MTLYEWLAILAAFANGVVMLFSWSTKKIVSDWKADAYKNREEDRAWIEGYFIRGDLVKAKFDTIEFRLNNHGDRITTLEQWEREQRSRRTPPR